MNETNEKLKLSIPFWWAKHRSIYPWGAQAILTAIDVAVLLAVLIIVHYLIQ